MIVVGLVSDPLANGPSTIGFVARFTSSGSFDTTFGSAGAQYFDGHAITDVALDAAGRIALVGGGVLRLTPSGQLDTAYGDNGAARSTVRRFAPIALLVDPAGAVTTTDWVAGTQRTPAQDNIGVSRFTPAGQADESFATGGTVSSDLPCQEAEPTAIAADRQGRIVAAGICRDVGKNDPSDFVVARYLVADGSATPTPMLFSTPTTVVRARTRLELTGVPRSRARSSSSRTAEASPGRSSLTTRGAPDARCVSC